MYVSAGGMSALLTEVFLGIRLRWCLTLVLPIYTASLSGREYLLGASAQGSNPGPKRVNQRLGIELWSRCTVIQNPFRHTSLDLIHQ